MPLGITLATRSGIMPTPREILDRAAHEAATTQVLEALRTARGDRHEAAKLLGLPNMRALYRLISRLGALEAVRAQDKAHGWRVWAPGHPLPKSGKSE